MQELQGTWVWDAIILRFSILRFSIPAFRGFVIRFLVGFRLGGLDVAPAGRPSEGPNQFRVWITGQVRRTTAALKREMKRRAAIEPIIGHLKAEHRMDRNYLKGRDGDRINATLAAARFNFHLLLRWFERLLLAWIQAILRSARISQIA